MDTFTEPTPCDAETSSGRRHRVARTAVAALSLGLLLGMGACAGPVDPIIVDQPDTRDPTTDPKDGTSFRGWMSDVQLAISLTPESSSLLG